jgi:hypothetical protein
MRALLTSAGIKNSSIHDALVDLLGKPIAPSSSPPASIPSPAVPAMRGGRSAAKLHRRCVNWAGNRWGSWN